MKFRQRETFAGMSMGYKTSAVCRLKDTGQYSSSGEIAMLVDVSVDGATVICEKPFSVGTRTTIAVEGISMAELPAIIVSNEGDFGGGYRLILRITRGSWPYQVFVTLTTLAAGTARNSSTPPPPCLEELGLKLPCSAEDVRIAFQRRVRGVHPDRGGDVESFVRLRAAYHQALDLLGGQR